jgi:hypothetical protein
MTEQEKRGRDGEQKQDTKGNLGQKEAGQEARSDAQIARMGELNKAKNK